MDCPIQRRMQTFEADDCDRSVKFRQLPDHFQLSGVATDQQHLNAGEHEGFTPFCARKI
ncbi:hypothetical protein D3C84_1193870 [compost metagenome]